MIIHHLKIVNVFRVILSLIVQYIAVNNILVITIQAQDSLKKDLAT